MKKKIKIQVGCKKCTPKAHNSKSMKIIVAETAMQEYLDIVRSECENERNKKVSFENRAGIFLALIGSFCVYLFDKIPFKDIFGMYNSTLSFNILIQIISGAMVYIALMFTLFCLIKTITVRRQNNFEVKGIDEKLLSEKRVDALTKVIFTYRDIIIQLRAQNERRAVTYKYSIYGVVAMLLSIVVYFIVSGR